MGSKSIYYNKIRIKTEKGREACLLCFAALILMVGDTGVEPVTSGM